MARWFKLEILIFEAATAVANLVLDLKISDWGRERNLFVEAHRMVIVFFNWAIPGLFFSIHIFPITMWSSKHVL